ncbi:MAG: choice-of-anchor E domain-containing protein [Planctomycetota bacterium]|jgi:hypothetical protein
MRRVRFYQIGICMLFLVNVLVWPAVATMYTQEKTFNGLPNFTTSRTFDQFDPSWGTLDSIKVTFNLNITGGQFGVDNDQIEATSGNVYFGAEGALSSSDVTLKNGSDNNVWDGLTTYTSHFFSLGADDGDGMAFDPSAPDGGMYNPGSASYGINDFINSVYFGDYTGTGTYDILLDIDDYIDVSSLSGICYMASPATASGSVIIDYNYTIPEPGTVLLFGLGGLGLLRKKRRG